MLNAYTLFDGLAYYVRIFCELRSIFPSLAGARKNTSNERNVRSYYMVNHRTRGLLFHKKNCHFAIGPYFLVRVFTEHPDSVCENDVNNEQNCERFEPRSHFKVG